MKHFGRKQFSNIRKKTTIVKILLEIRGIANPNTYSRTDMKLLIALYVYHYMYLSYRCISLTSHSEGPLLLLERLCDNNIFLLNSSDCVDKNSNSFVFSGSGKHKLNWNNATCADECIPGSTSGLLATKLSNSTAKFVTSRYPNAQILLDRNGYIRPIQSFYRLRPPFYQLHNAFESISISSLVIKNKEYIVLLCMGKKKELIRAIEQRDVGLFEDLSNQYLDR